MSRHGMGEQLSWDRDRLLKVVQGAMATVLKRPANVAKGDRWEEKDFAWLIQRAREELDELEQAVGEFEKHLTMEKWLLLSDEGGDVASFIGMIIDKADATTLEGDL